MLDVQTATLPPPVHEGETMPSHCLNCGAALTGPYCAQCGQEAESRIVTMRHLLHHFLGDFFSFDARYIQTVIPLIRRPGLLTNEYLAGRRVRYVPPLRLYVFTSFVLFFSLALMRVDLSGVFYEVPAAPTAQQATPETPADVADEIARETAVVDSLGIPLIGRLKQGAMTAMRDPDPFLDRLLDRLPMMMFILLPLFALLLKLTYISSGRLYAEHFIFALHVHAFAFMTYLMTSLFELVLGNPSDKSDNLPFTIIVLVYLFLALRRVYGQSRWKSTVKTFFLFNTYFFFLLIGLLVVGVLTLLFL